MTFFVSGTFATRREFRRFLLARIRTQLPLGDAIEDVLLGDLSGTSAIIPELKRVIHDRRLNPKEGSYTTSLFANEDRMLKKVVEEAAEVALASKSKDKKMQAWEVADLIYHLMVVLEGEDISLDQVYQVLSERRK